MEQKTPSTLTLSKSQEESDLRQQETDEPIIIHVPRLGELAPITKLHYQGPKTPTPPKFDLKERQSYDQVSVCKKLQNITKALESDTEWLVTLIMSDNDGMPGIEW